MLIYMLGGVAVGLLLRPKLDELIKEYSKKKDDKDANSRND